MPLPMKTLAEAAAELGMPERELRTMVDLRKVRAVLKASKLMIAPDEIAKLRRLRKTLPESAQSTPAAPPKAPPAGAKGTASTPAASRPAVPRAKLKLPPPPPQ
jgi:hypothetical protein